MIRLIMLTDFTETFSYRLQRGILQYARDNHEQWMVCRMPLSYKNERGLDGVVRWAEEWKADAIMGKFEQDDDLQSFIQRGIVVIAQDHKRLFKTVPNVTSNYLDTSRMAASYFLDRGFNSFAYCGYNEAVWSEERCRGFRKGITDRSNGCHFSLFTDTLTDEPWRNNDLKLIHWLQSLPRRTAIFCCDDRQASVVLSACNEAGIKVPADFVVMGVDNDELVDELDEPTLSSVNLDIEQGGYAMAQMIEAIKQTGQQGNDIIIQPTGIIPRQSTNTFAAVEPYVQKAIDFIHNNLDRQFTITDLLRHLPVSRRLFEIRFREVTGFTPHNYMIRHRIERFAQRLLSSALPIKEIAFDMEFNNYGNLIRLFKTYLGCTPSEYREQHRWHGITIQ